MNLSNQLIEFSNSCFAIEDQLELGRFNEELSDEQYFRRELYKIRIRINELQHYAKSIDKSRELRIMSESSISEE